MAPAFRFDHLADLHLQALRSPRGSQRTSNQGGHEGNSLAAFIALAVLSSGK